MIIASYWKMRSVLKNDTYVNMNSFSSTDLNITNVSEKEDFSHTFVSSVLSATETQLTRSSAIDRIQFQPPISHSSTQVSFDWKNLHFKPRWQFLIKYKHWLLLIYLIYENGLFQFGLYRRRKQPIHLDMIIFLNYNLR